MCIPISTQPWIAMVNAKKNIMLATAYHRQGLASQESSSFGPAIAYLQVCTAEGCDTATPSVT